MFFVYTYLYIYTYVAYIFKNYYIADFGGMINPFAH